MWRGGRGAMAMNVRTWSRGGGRADVEPWRWTYGCGAVDVEVRTWSRGCGGVVEEPWR